jgi:hypothetical protein
VTRLVAVVYASSGSGFADVALAVFQPLQDLKLQQGQPIPPFEIGGSLGEGFAQHVSLPY